ncbi:alpha/beta hydrolase [Enterovibrio sp. ZSDZ35]|uniref:Alpha/beta hydrolase n=1 Tax=Enterovibrio qingdaonensis TaxID=2899818 RepID=A0ABT5QLK8_9GAMM|nr:alpha/beta hydrolase [Enterovibrio sp. ZSDZ35]MDD1781186.1 alpha/beta hydrolase [Enterovibrio sp. ZSDZ35]
MPTIISADIPIHFERRGSGSPLVFLHGLGSSSVDWSEQIAFFSQNFDVIAPDFPLHGQSGGKIETFSLPHCADVIHDLLNQLSIEKATVVGVSMGGMVGMELAIRYPEKIAKLAVVNALAECKPRMAIEWWMLLTRRFLLKFVSVARIAKMMGDQLLPGEALKEKRIEAVARWSLNDRASYIASFNALLGWQVLDKLALIRCPLFLISAEFDHTPPTSKKVLAALYPDGEFSMIAGMRHLVPLESPDTFNQILNDWLHRHASSRR